MPELEIAAKTAGVHRVATKNLASLIAAIEDVLRPSTKNVRTSPDETSQSYANVSKDKVD
jgi:hypothetical protein